MYLGENPNKHSEWFQKRLGSNKYEELNIRAEKIVKIDRDEIEQWLKTKIAEIKKW